MLKSGDRVELIDDDLQGKLKSVSGEKAVIITEDGFEMTFPVSQLVKIHYEIEEEIDDDEIAEALKAKKQPKKPRSVSSTAKKKQIPPMEVDLHINQLVRSTKSLTNHEMLNLQLDTARHKLEFAIRKRIQRVVFIHGVGEGVLKMELEYLLGRYSNIKFYDADYKQYGLGATEVYIFQNS